MIASKYHIRQIPCRNCGVKALRYVSIVDNETLVGKTWKIGRTIILCRNCGKDYEHNEYEQTIDQVKKFRSLFYL